MENAIASLLMIGLLIFGAMTVSSSSMNAIDDLTASWKTMEKQERNTRLTSIAIASCETYANGARVEISVRNNGSCSISNFTHWDVIAHYSSGATQWLSYTDATPGWSISGITIFSNGGSEVVDPGILNPGEAALLIVRLDPAVAVRSNNWLKVSTPNGITAETAFSWSD
jgi:hypothetical protein